MQTFLDTLHLAREKSLDNLSTSLFEGVA